MFIINSIVDLKKNKLTLEPGIEFNCVQGDSGASYKIYFNFKGMCIDTSKISGILTFVLPDGESYVDSVEFLDKSTACYSLKDQLLAQSGKIQTSLTLLDSNRFTVYTSFIINVKPNPSDTPIDIDPEDSTYLLLQSLMTEVRNLEESVKTNENIRLTNETLRVSNEEARIQAEILRTQAEQLRTTEWDNLKKELQKILDKIEAGLTEIIIDGRKVSNLKIGEGLELQEKNNEYTLVNKGILWKTL